MRYTLWALGLICIIILFLIFFNIMTSENISATVPQGYRFSVSDNYNSSGKIRTTYYVYDNKIIVEDEGFTDNRVNRSVLIYDGINTASLEYVGSDTMELCELGSCSEKPKILATIKSLISRKIGREYIGL